jgi:hypothetical protein
MSYEDHHTWLAAKYYLSVLSTIPSVTACAACIYIRIKKIDLMEPTNQVSVNELITLVIIRA